MIGVQRYRRSCKGIAKVINKEISSINVGEYKYIDHIQFWQGQRAQDWRGEGEFSIIVYTQVWWTLYWATGMSSTHWCMKGWVYTHIIVHAQVLAKSVGADVTSNHTCRRGGEISSSVCRCSIKMSSIQRCRGGGRSK